jgi:hypothetical protein
MEDQTVKIYTLEREHEYLLPLIDEIFTKNNIAYHVRSKYDRAYDGVFVGQKGIGDLYVFKYDQVKAEQILKEILNSQPGEDTP